MKTLNVVKTSHQEIMDKWGFWPLISSRELFIRCNSNGVINWDKAPVYTWNEILKEQLKRRVCFIVPKEEFKL